jgi:hypothetical protein
MYLGHVGGLPVVDLVSAVSWRGACVDGGGRLGLDAVDAASGAHETVGADGAVVADVEQEVANHTRRWLLRRMRSRVASSVSRHSS